MKYATVVLMVFFFVQVSFAQDADTTIATFTIRKPEPKKPAGKIYLMSEGCTVRKVRNIAGWTALDNFPGSIIIYTADNARNNVVLDFEYPPAAIESRIIGEVTVGYDIDETGKPINVKVMKSANDILDEATLILVRNLQPKPEEVVEKVSKAKRKAGLPFFMISIRFALR